jgi:hypothetical protein
MLRLMRDVEHAYFSGIIDPNKKVVELTGSEIDAEISGLASQLGRKVTLVEDTIEVKLVPEESGARLKELLSRHPQGERLAAQVDEKMLALARNTWFVEGLNTGSEPTMEYGVKNEATQNVLKFLRDKGIVDGEMAENYRINLPGSVYLKLKNERNPRTRMPDEAVRQLVSGENEDIALEIIKLKAEIFTEEQRQLLKESEEDEE